MNLYVLLDLFVIRAVYTHDNIVNHSLCYNKSHTPDIGTLVANLIQAMLLVVFGDNLWHQCFHPIKVNLRIKWSDLPANAKIDYEVLESYAHQVRLSSKDEQQMVESSPLDKPLLVAHFKDVFCKLLVEFNYLITVAFRQVNKDFH